MINDGKVKYSGYTPLVKGKAKNSAKKAAKSRMVAAAAELGRAQERYGNRANGYSHPKIVEAGAAYDKALAEYKSTRKRRK